MSAASSGGKKLRILLLEDSPEDVELITNALRGERLACELMSVNSSKGFRKGLGEFHPDVILSDYSLPLFDGEMALRTALEKRPESPFIFVTGAIGEERAVEMLLKGATDFILKSNLSRLVPSIRRAVRESRLVRDRRALMAALRDMEERYRSLVENLPVGVFRTSIAQPARILHANLALARMFGIERTEEIISIPVMDLYYDEADRDRFLEEITEKGSVINREIRLRRKSGEILWASVTATPHWNDSGAADWIDGIVEDITARKNSEKALRLSEERFRGIFESSRDAILINEPPEWLYTTGNPAALEMFRLRSMEELLSLEPWQLSPERQPDGVNSQERVKEITEIAMREGSCYFEWTHRRADGELFPAAVLLTRVDAAGKRFLQATVRDITGQKRAEMELRRTNEELDLLLRSLTSVLIGVSTKDRITHWNPAAEKMFGIDAADVIGKNFTECGVGWDWQKIYEGISTCLIEDKPVRTDDVRYRRPDGSDGVLGFTVNPLIQEGDVLAGFIIIGTDLTERRLLERQLLTAQKLESLGQLAAGVAHEINSPLQFVGDNLRFIQKTAAQLLRAAAQKGEPEDFAYLSEELPKAIYQSIDGITRVSHIVQSMKAFAHPGKGVKSPADINKSIENTAAVSRNEWKYDADLELDLDKGLPMVPCFETELNQVVLNLIVNAVDAVKDALKKKMITRGLIKIETRREGNDAVIRVSDNGMGIPEAIRGRIFDPFFTTKEVGRGTGQGLAISHSIIVEKHSGSIYFETEAGKGTKFIIRLPM